MVELSLLFNFPKIYREEGIMAKYHLYWKLDESRVPVDAKERGGSWGLFMEHIAPSSS